MKAGWIVLIAVLLGAALASGAAERAAPASPPAQTGDPKIQFAVPVFDFGRVVAGETVKHSYVFTNTGTGTLEVTGVHASCGCTVPGTWSRRVEPGDTGTIPIEFNGGSFNGPIVKMITVTSNDKTQPTMMLQVKGTIWRPIEVNPQFAVMTVSSDAPSNATAVVRIINNQEQPIELFDPRSSQPLLTADIKTVKPGKEFELTVRTVPPLPAGNHQGLITIQTSSTNSPKIHVTALAMVQPPVVVMPPQITLPAAPLQNPIPYTVSIRNNSSQPLTLTEPSVNAENVNAEVKEIQPGRQFAVVISFPPGFAIPEGQKVELTVKSSNPGYEVIKVPITQLARRAAAPSRSFPPAPAAPSAPAS